MNPAVELLIHISAPSRGSDDAKYRKQALGFLGFEAATRHSILPRNGRPKERASSDGGRSCTEDAEALGQPNEHLRREDSDGDEQKTHPYLRAVITSQSPSRTGVPDVPASPPPPVTPTCPPPTISTSSLPTAFSTPLSTPVPSLHIPQMPLPATAPPASPTAHSPHPLPRTPSDPWEPPSSEVPDSQPPHHSPTPRPPWSSQSSPRPPSPTRHPPPASPPPAKRRRLNAASPSPTRASPPPRTAHSSPPRLRASPSAHPPHRRPPSSPAQTTPQPPPLTSQPPLLNPPVRGPLFAHPPLPPSTHPPFPPSTTLNPFTTHLTPSLTLLAQHLPLSTFFRPAYAARELRILERGCWVVELGGAAGDSEGATRGGKGRMLAKGGREAVANMGVGRMEEEEEEMGGGWRASFWGFLGRFVGEGRGGWGVWCELVGAGAGGVMGGGEEEEGRGGDVVKVYCWGEVVGHVWLLLFLASERKVRGLGARWVDAGGEVVVRMG